MPSIHALERVVRLELTAQQIAPLVQGAAAKGNNVLLFALAVPFWQQEAIVWELQTTLIPARISHKIIKLVRSTEET